MIETSASPISQQIHRYSKSALGFSLIELLSVMAILAMLMALITPAFNAIRGGNDVSRSTYDIASLLQEARTYAIANNTYVWVGFYEEDGNKPSTTPATAGNGGRVVISVVASKDGTRYSDGSIDAATPAAFGGGSTSNPTQLAQINRLVKLDNVRLAALNDGTANGGGLPARPGVQAAYQVGDALTQGPNNAGGSFAQHVGAGGNPTTFKYPLTGTAQYTFSKIIEFNPQGEASKIVGTVFTGPGPQDAMEIAIVPTHGSTIDSKYSGGSKAATALQIEGITGQVRIYRL